MEYDTEEFKKALKENTISVQDFSSRYSENPNDLDELLAQTI
jgi:hypothetical protein